MKVTHPNIPAQTQDARAVDKLKNTDQKTQTERLGNKGTEGFNLGAQVDISDEAKLLQMGKERVLSLSDRKSDRLEAIKKSIQDGTYQVDAAKVADKLVDEHVSSHLGKNSL